MKDLILLFFIGLILSSCSKNGSSKITGNQSESDLQETAQTGLSDLNASLPQESSSAGISQNVSETDPIKPEEEYNDGDNEYSDICEDIEDGDIDDLETDDGLYNFEDAVEEIVQNFYEEHCKPSK